MSMPITKIVICQEGHYVYAEQKFDLLEIEKTFSNYCFSKTTHWQNAYIYKLKPSKKKSKYLTSE